MTEPQQHLNMLIWHLLYRVELRGTVMKSHVFGDTIRLQHSSSMQCPMANPACCLCAPTDWCQLRPGLLQFQSSLLHSLQVTPQWSRIAQFLHPHSLFVLFSSGCNHQQVWYSAAVCAPKMGSTLAAKATHHEVALWPHQSLCLSSAVWCELVSSHLVLAHLQVHILYPVAKEALW